MGNVDRIASLLKTSRSGAIEFQSQVRSMAISGLSGNIPPEKVSLHEIAELIQRQLDDHPGVPVRPDEIAGTISTKIAKWAYGNAGVAEPIPAVMPLPATVGEARSPAWTAPKLIAVAPSPVQGLPIGTILYNRRPPARRRPVVSNPKMAAGRRTQENQNCVQLDQATVDRCDAFGRRSVQSYGDGNKSSSKALAVPGRPPIHGDWQVQADGRLAELAFVRAVGFTDDELDWSNQCDAGFDAKLYNLTFDVKSSSIPNARRLIWPVSKNHFIDQASMTTDILVFVRISRDQDKPGAVAEMVGWIGFSAFIAKHKISDGADQLTVGTKYMMDTDLNEMSDLFRIIEAAKAAHPQTGTSVGTGRSYRQLPTKKPHVVL